MYKQKLQDTEECPVARGCQAYGQAGITPYVVHMGQGRLKWWGWIDNAAAAAALASGHCSTTSWAHVHGDDFLGSGTDATFAAAAAASRALSLTRPHRRSPGFLLYTSLTLTHSRLPFISQVHRTSASFAPQTSFSGSPVAVSVKMPPMPGNEKANPNIAMNEATPQEQWQGMALDYVPYISKDIYGNTIAEPDLSNPTRSRHERPLDTIKSFEAAAYGKEYTIGDGASETGLQRGGSRQSMANYDTRRPVLRNSSTSGFSNTQRNYSYGNMQDQYVDDGASEIQGGPARDTPATPQLSGENRQPSSASWEPRHQGYGSPASDSGRAQFTAPVPQKLNFTTAPMTPPQDPKPVEKKKGWGKRLSFGKNKQ